jgi:hypothetical protein
MDKTDKSGSESGRMQTKAEVKADESGRIRTKAEADKKREKYVVI